MNNGRMNPFQAYFTKEMGHSVGGTKMKMRCEGVYMDMFS